MVERVIFSLDRLNLPVIREKDEGKEVKEAKSKEKGFLELLQDGVKKVNQLEKEADSLSQKLATGELDDIHELTIAIRKAELAVRLLTEIRNRIIDAYDRLTRLT